MSLSLVVVTTGTSAVPGVQVDGLRADQDQGVAMGAQGHEGVEQRTAGVDGDLGVAHWRQRSSLELIQEMSASPSSGSRPGPANRSTATWE